MIRPSALLVGALAIAASVGAQVQLDKFGGGLPGAIGLEVRATANTPYLMLFAFNEQQTPLPTLGITLDIPDTFVGVAVTVPGFLGVTDGAGRASAGLTLPADPIFESVVISFQAVAGSNPYQVSNLVRVTPQLVGTFKPSLQDPTLPILGGAVATAPDGGLLFAGGSGPVAQLYKSRTEEWVNGGVAFGVGLLSQSTGLPDGRVLFTGGLDLTTGQPTAAAAVWDPASGQTTTLNMAIPRAGHGASLLANGRVLITGGFETLDLTNPIAIFNGLRATSEFFDPNTNTFVPGPTMLEARALHSSTTLTNGEVLVAGGLTLLPIINIPTVSQTAYRFNPNNNSFGLPALFQGPRFFHSAVALSDGKVLLCGGLSLDLTTFLQTGNVADIIVGTRTDCQLYSRGLLGFGTFAGVNGMQEGRAGAAIAPLPNGGALIAGGFRLTLDIPNSTFEATATATADIFAQGPNSITPTGSMAAPRLFPLATALPDGTIMVVGGGPLEAEIYQR
jgi:hypothetical protein